MLKKPQDCFLRNCPLASKGFGYAGVIGPADAKIVLVGEALGQMEAIKGEPFVGDAGGMLDRLLHFIHMDRSEFLIDNTCRCKPPNNWLDGAPWEDGAVLACSPNLEETLASSDIKVVVPLGGTAIRRILGIPKRTWKTYRKPMENFHGTIVRDPQDRFWVVPNFHPSYILRGNHNLMGVAMRDFLLAKEIAENGHIKESPDLRVDPPVEWFMAWVRIIIDKSLELAAAGKDLLWLAVDIETPEKEKGIDESEIAVDDPSFIITRVNLATNLDLNFALTVPWHGPYITGIKMLLACETIRKSLWNANYDRPRLIKNGVPLTNPWYDFMDGWHMLQSDLPRGLGFVAPFYSRYGPWKHLSGTDPGLYAAIDALQTIRITVGLGKDLVKSGQWESFERHGALVDRYALKPAEEVGLPFTRRGLEEFSQELESVKTETTSKIKKHIPEELIPLEPKNGYKKQPLDDNNEPDPEYFPVTYQLDCYKCNACGKVAITTKHRCKERKFYEAEHKKQPFEFGNWEIDLWHKKGEFNPGSPQQVLQYIKYRGHKPGKNKKTRSDSADADTIDRLAKRHGGPVYENLLTLRKIDKVKGTYVDGALRQMDEEGRVHPIYTNLPSTWRTSCQGFNLQNQITVGKRKDLGLGEKFRNCVVPEPGCVLLEADYCVAPEVKILRSNLTWDRADNIKAGDELIGFDDAIGKGAGKRNKFRASIVKRTKMINRPRVRITTTHGTITVATEHPFVGRWAQGKEENQRRHNRTWIKAKDLKIGTYLSFCAAPWKIETSQEAGYLAGFFDGEGWVSKTTVGVAQNKGPTLNRILRMLDTRQFKFRKSNSSSTAHVEILTGLQGVLTFLGSIRPPRLMEKARQIWEGRQTWGKKTPVVRVTAIELLDEGPVVAIETSTKTYISEGFFSHNSGIEAVQVGWFANDPSYVRLSKMSTHAFIATHMKSFEDKIACLDWSDDELRSYLSWVKHEKKYKLLYNRAKRVVHGSAYGLSARGLKLTYPEEFPTIKDAQNTLDLFFSLFPLVKSWQTSVRLRAHEQHYLGGGDHPFRYKHWFWHVFNYKRISAAQARAARASGAAVVEIGGQWYLLSLGNDAKRCIAFYPQSTAGGVLRETMLNLFIPGSENFIGEVFFGRTPLRAPIHDSLLLEVPKTKLDFVIERVYKAMIAPITQQPCPEEWGIGEHLTIGVEMEVGESWGKMEALEIDNIS